MSGQYTPKELSAASSFNAPSLPRFYIGLLCSRAPVKYSVCGGGEGKKTNTKKKNLPYQRFSETVMLLEETQ
jgi:hypothetical protein